MIVAVLAFESQQHELRKVEEAVSLHHERRQKEKQSLDLQMAEIERRKAHSARLRAGTHALRNFPIIRTLSTVFVRSSS